MKTLRAKWDTLTPREREVFRLVVTGMLNKQVAFELGTVEKTIKVHRGRVMEKMGAQSLADLVRFCRKAGDPLPAGLTDPIGLRSNIIPPYLLVHSR